MEKDTVEFHNPDFSGDGKISPDATIKANDDLDGSLSKAETISSKSEAERRPTELDDTKPENKAALKPKLHLHRKSVANVNSKGLILKRSRSAVTGVLHGTKNVLKGCWIMFTGFPYWDMAFWAGWSYSVGSVLFIVDGCWSWTPIAFPGSEFPGEKEYGGPVLFFVGALLYQLGATMAYLEAINDGSFAGPAMKRLLEGQDDQKKALFDNKLHLFFGHIIPHHHDHDDDEEDEKPQEDVDPEAGWKTKDRPERPGSIYPAGKEPAPRREAIDMGPAEQGDFHEYLTWRWWPTWHALWSYHIKELGYVACAIQLFGATLYGISGVVVLPGILDSLETWQELGAYWVPQIVGSCCFLIAGIMFTLINQDKWYQPLPKKISWWVGAWAITGSIGFL